MDFRTVVAPIEGMNGLVSHDNPLLLIGSCFTDNIGQCLVAEMFDVCVNPFGPLYNPLSIRKAFSRLRNQREITADELTESHGGVHSFLFHSRFSGSTSNEALLKMNTSLREGAAMMRTATTIIITLGTTRVFTLRHNGEVASNCHKLPSSQFDSRHLTLDEVKEALDDTIRIIREVNTTAHVIFTVSPLRYTEQGLHANQINKATLLLGIDGVIKSDTSGLLSYFPAYEIMMDDLRDYRFYAEDMKHPTPQAVRYIYGIFKASYCDQSTLALADEAASLTRRLSHRPLTSSPEILTKERIEKERLITDFIARHPKLHNACKRYINITTDNGI